MKHFKNVHVGKSTVVLTKVPDQVKTKAIKIDLSNEEQDAEIIPWGSDNLYPQNFYNKKFLRNGAAVGGITTLKSSHYGNGFSLIKEFDDEAEGVVIKKERLGKYPAIRDFARRCKFNRFWYETITDQSMFHIAFTEFVLSKDFNSIVLVERKQAAHCRFGKPDNTGKILKVYLNTDWATANKEFTIPFDYMDPRMSVEEIKEYCKQKKITNFVTAIWYPLIDESFYPKTDWHAVDRNGWMDVANSVPELKQAIFENQQHFKYIVYISDYYFESYYKDEWDDFDADKRQQMRDELASVID